MGCLLMLFQKSLRKSSRVFIKCHENLFPGIQKCQPRTAAENIVYRDAVSDSQFTEILAIELAGMLAACMEIEANYEPGFTIVIIQKRHRAQFPRPGG